jgi:hypothetical protein
MFQGSPSYSNLPGLESPPNWSANSTLQLESPPDNSPGFVQGNNAATASGTSTLELAPFVAGGESQSNVF